MFGLLLLFPYGVQDPGKLRIHMAMNHGGETMKCNMCSYETPILKYLIKHKKKMHEVSNHYESLILKKNLLWQNAQPNTLNFIFTS